MSLWDHFWSILRLFDQTPYFRVKRFLQTVFGNVLVGSYFVQRNRNIAAAAPLSGLVPNSKSGIWAHLKNGRGIFFENPKPICTDRSSWIYFSRLQVRRSPMPTSKGLAFAHCNKELEPAEVLDSSYWHPVYLESQRSRILQLWEKCHYGTIFGRFYHFLSSPQIFMWRDFYKRSSVTT